eukprot:gene6768-4858_t
MGNGLRNTPSLALTYNDGAGGTQVRYNKGEGRNKSEIMVSKKKKRTEGRYPVRGRAHRTATTRKRKGLQGITGEQMSMKSSKSSSDLLLLHDLAVTLSLGSQKHYLLSCRFHFSAPGVYHL